MSARRALLGLALAVALTGWSDAKPAPARRSPPTLKTISRYATRVNPGSGVEFPSVAAGFALNGQPLNTLDHAITAPYGLTIVWPSPSVLVSHDRGRSWQRSLSAPGGFWGLYFADGMRGMAVGVKALYRTADGGRHWWEISEPREPLVRVVLPQAYPVGSTVVGLTTTGQLVTRDIGSFWGPASWRGVGRALCLVGPEILVADRRGGVWRSKAALYPFSEVASGRKRPLEESDWWIDLSCAGENAVEFMQAVPQAAGASVETIIRQSIDGGMTWRQIAQLANGAANENAPLPMQAVAVGTRTACIVSYPRSPTLDIHCTSDGGRSFRRAETPLMPHRQIPDVHLQGVAFLGPSFGWLLAVDSLAGGRQPARYQTEVWETDDSGGSWRVEYAGTLRRVPMLR